MSNKVITWLLIFLLVVDAVLGFYSINFHNQLTAFKEETATEISDVRSDITTLDSVLRDSINEVQGNVNALRTEFTDFKTTTTTQMARVNTELSQSTVNVQRLYDSVSKTVCQITDGVDYYGSGFVLDTRGLRRNRSAHN